MALKIAFVSRDPAVRLAAAKALEAAPDDWVIELAADAPPDADVVVCGPDVAGCRGIPFDRSDPGSIVGAIAAAGRPARVVAVVGACGGCGVTTIAAHLARAWSSCVVECGSRAGLAERLGLVRQDVRTWDGDEESFDLCALPMAGGFRAFFASIADPPGLEDVVETARTRFASVVLDVPVGHELPAACSALTIVMPPTIPGALRARPYLQSVPPTVTTAVIANRVGPGGEATRAVLEEVLGDHVTLELPCSAALRDAEDDGALLPPRHRWARRLERFGRVLAGAASRQEDTAA